VYDGDTPPVSRQVPAFAVVLDQLISALRHEGAAVSASALFCRPTLGEADQLQRVVLGVDNA
jgi:hypothetical protein